jgi:hypothetical protein
MWMAGMCIWIGRCCKLNILLCYVPQLFKIHFIVLTQWLNKSENGNMQIRL